MKIKKAPTSLGLSFLYLNEVCFKIVSVETCQSLVVLP